MTKILHTLDHKKGIKHLSHEELQVLADDVREVILDILPKTGGHLASNLGVVELTIALHYVYNYPVDQLVFDVGHQAYTHKLLTGRLENFHTLRQMGGVSGFPNPWESEYDNFYTGHAGTATSMALGLSMGYEYLGDDRRVACIVGDGSFCGLTFEGLNHCGELKKRMVVILNDNKMAISPTVGAFSKSLNKLRSDEHYVHVMDEIHKGLQKLPLVGETLDHMREVVLGTLKTNLLAGQFFTELGFEYYGPVDGHDLPELVQMIHNVREINRPVLLHVLTQKGKGSPLAEKDPLTYYQAKKPAPANADKNAVGWSQCFSEVLEEAARSNDKIMAITAAMAQGTKLEQFMRELPERFIDTGIAEAHAVTLASGLDYAGIRPVIPIYSTFLQRSYDSVMHDICLQKGGAVIIAIDRAGIGGDDGPSHHGVYDVAFLRHLPRMVLMAPRDGVELKKMFNWALGQSEPVAIRYPRGNVPKRFEGRHVAEVELGKPEIMEQGNSLALIAFGAMVEHADEAMDQLRENGYEPTLVNLRFAKPICADSIRRIVENHEVVCILEDHALMGGVGSAILELISDHGIKAGKIIRFGVNDEFVPHGERSQLLELQGLDTKSIVSRIMQEVPARAAAATK